MIFYFPIETLSDDRVSAYKVDTGSDCARTNKRKLKEFLAALGEPESNHKRVLKSMGFWGAGLGRQGGTR